MHNDLAKRLTEARDAYYNGTPIMSDAAFDALEDQLRALDPTHPAILKVGAAAPSGGAWPKVKHDIPMSSLNKAQTPSEFEDWVQTCKSLPMVGTLKKDGLSVSLLYKHRKYTQALTRGDGSIGEDITRNVALMSGVVKMLPPTLPDGTVTPDVVYVRGEIICKKSDHKTYFPGESNPRNTASGTAKRQSAGWEKCAHLTVMTYQLFPNGVVPASKDTELRWLTQMGFNVAPWVSIASFKEAHTWYETYVSGARATLDFDIDGLVFDINDRSVREALGELNNRPKGSVAWKFPHESKATKLLDIEWQVGNSGRITPVAIFEPVTLAGASISRASLAGIRQVEHLKLYKGCNILVARRNDCIPRVESNLDLAIENDL